MKHRNATLTGILLSLAVANSYARPDDILDADIKPLVPYATEVDKALFKIVDGYGSAIMAYGNIATMPTVNAEYFRRLHRDIWRNDGVCRHAGAAVQDIAQEENLESKLVIFDLHNSKDRHAIPLVKMNGNWYAFESMSYDNKHWTSRSRNTSSETRIAEDVEWYKNIFPNDGRQLRSVLGEASQEAKNRWLIQLNDIYPSWRQNNGRK